MTELSRAVFLSYASQDSEAARRICEALRAAGVEIWFDQSDLRGGDAWDQRIRLQIRECALFMALISANTDARPEGYFRLEWKLAVDRSHLMADDEPFLLPVVIDGTDEATARVPDRLRQVQWTHLPRGETPPAFVERVSNLLRVERTPASRRPAPPVGAPARAPQPPRRLTFALLLSAAALIMVAGYFAFERHARLPAPVISAAQPAFVPPPHSVAVLPFANLSGDANQEYLSDGLSEELLNALTRIDGLQVAARTSSFSFKGTNVDIATIARRLNVGAVLEGSLRRSGRKVRVTAQLINAVTGFHIWSQTYDEDLTDALIVQTSVATAVAHELDVALSGNPLSKIGQGGTRSAEALDAYLRGAHVMGRAHNTEDMRLAIADFDEAIKFDRKYAAAYAVRASAFTNICAGTFDLKLLPDLRTQAKQSAEAAVALAPDFPLALIVRGFVRAVALLDFGSAGPDFERAIQLSPGSALAQKGFALYSSIVGHPQAAIAASRRAVELDPENYSARSNFVIALLAARRYTDALQAIADWKASDPRVEPSEWLGPIYLATGRPDLALKICDNTLDGPSPEFRCLAMAHHALGHHPQAESVLRRMQQKYGDSHAFGYAEIYAQWGNVAEAIRWLRVAAQLRVSELQALRSSWALDPVRGESAYHEIEREFNFPPN